VWTEVKLYAGDPPRAPAVNLGPVAFDVIGNGDDVAAEAKRAVAAIGADAVVRVRLTKLHGFAARTGLTGIAVRMAP
jgi:hypothetical protein